MSRESIFQLIAGECEKLPADRDGKFKHRGLQYWCRCPWHGGGMENTGSLKISLDPEAPVPPGHAFCFGCKVSCDWNTLAQLFGLRTVRSGAMKEATAEGSYLRTENFDDTTANVPELAKMTRWPFDMEWRTISGATVAKYGGRSILFGRNPFLYLPIMMYGEHVAGINCRLVRDRTNKAEKAYINTAEADTATKLFGFDVARKRGGGQPLWVVEGPRDTMWIEQAGCAAVGLIGSAVTARKIALIRDLDPVSIVSAVDPDDAGDGAHAALVAAFENEIPIERYPYKNSKDDPCTLSPDRIARATRLMRKYQ